MKIDETPEGLQSIDTSVPEGALAPMPEMLDALGGAGEEMALMGRAPTQAELDRRSTTEESITEGQSLSPVQASLRRLGRDRRAMFFTAVTLLIIVIAYVGPLIYTRIGPNIIGGVTGTDTLTPLEYHNYVQVDI